MEGFGPPPLSPLPLPTELSIELTINQRVTYQSQSTQAGRNTGVDDRQFISPVDRHQSVSDAVSYKQLSQRILARQEAQLSQRDRAILRVTEYFAMSVKATRGNLNDTVEYGVCKSLLVF